MKVKVAKVGEHEYVVVVPAGYSNSALNINKIAKAVNSPTGASWHIVYGNTLIGVEI